MDWNALVPEPTSLIALWPHAAPPTRENIVAAFAQHLGEASVLESRSADDSGVAWSAAIAVPLGPSPVVVWVEAAQPLSEAERAAIGATECPWAIGIQAQLDRADPLTAFHHLVGAVAGSLRNVPAILDVDTTRWYPRADLDALFALGGPEPGADVLWTIHVVEGSAARSGTEAAPVAWLHTHGLRRCGRPELEMIEVPSAEAGRAADLLQDLADLLLERAYPPLGASIEIGPDLSVAMLPWEDVAPFVADGAPGGMADRAGDRAEAHAGPGAVICAPVPEGAYRKLWVWPSDAVGRRARAEAAVFVTTRATERQATLARAAWTRFVEAFSTTSSDARFGVKAGFPDDHARGREHLWFEVCRAEAGRVEGRLVHEPVAVRDLREGDRTWIDLDQVTDWRVVTRRGAFGPDAADHLAAALASSEAAP